MTKKLLDKLGFNSFHDGYTNLWDTSNIEYSVKYCLDAGVKYIRPAFRLLEDEFNLQENNWRVAPFRYMIRNGLKPVLNLLPSELQDHMLDDNADELVGQAIKAYTQVIDDLLNNDIKNTDFIIEAWNEWDSNAFTMPTKGGAQTNSDIMNRCLRFNREMCQVCKQRGVEYWDLDSVEYPNAPEIQKAMSLYDDTILSYTSKPDRITFHPYCERKKNDNIIPEHYLINFNLDNFENLHNWGVPIAISEFGYPTVEWGKPFSGQYATEYAYSMMLRQIMIHDYMGVDPMIIYSANTNPPQDKATSDQCWGMLNFNSNNNSVEYSPLGIKMLWWLQSMKGYYQTAFHSSLDDMVDVKNSDINYAWFTAEYQDHDSHKKLFYWSPFGKQNIKYQLDGWNTTLKNANQFIKCIEG